MSYSDSSASLRQISCANTTHSAVNENPTGAVQSFSININGALSGPTDTVGTGGNGPAFCAQLSNGKVAAVNFGSGDGSFTSTSSDGTLVQQPTSYITFPKPSYPPPKNVSNPHMVLEHNNEVFVPDLVSVVIYLWPFGC